jgi:signal transduction histidine kinase
LVVAVTDTGEGILVENLERLFNKFIQFSSSARDSEHKGTGLGLVIVKGIVEAHGGVIGVGSKKGTGSTFYFTLPL